MRRGQCTNQCRRGRSCARAACLGHGRGGLGAGCGGQRARTTRSPATLRVCLQRYMVRARTLWHFGIRSAACFVFGNGFSSGGVMPDHAGEQWRASIAEK